MSTCQGEAIPPIERREHFRAVWISMLTLRQAGTAALGSLAPLSLALARALSTVGASRLRDEDRIFTNLYGRSVALALAQTLPWRLPRGPGGPREDAQVRQRPPAPGCAAGLGGQEVPPAPPPPPAPASADCWPPLGLRHFGPPAHRPCTATAGTTPCWRARSSEEIGTARQSL